VAQDPESAEFTPMPRHLIDTGYADHVLRPREMPDVLLSYAVHPYVRGSASGGHQGVRDRHRGKELAERARRQLSRRHRVRGRRAAAGAVLALESFDTSPPDLILSDISLPGEDGYALIRRIRAREAQSGAVPVPAVALTAYAGETDRRMALEAGYQQHLGKPIGPDDLLVELRALREVTRRD
jgi:CheY-like chemotaxis protein